MNMNTYYTFCTKAAHTFILYFQISHIECKSNKLEHILHKSNAKIYVICVNLTVNLTTTDYTFLRKTKHKNLHRKYKFDNFLPILQKQ